MRADTSWIRSEKSVTSGVDGVSGRRRRIWWEGRRERANVAKNGKRKGK